LARSNPDKASSLGALFDWDGVVVDSSRHHEESWERLAKEEGKTLPHGHFLKGFGMKNEVIIPGFLAWTQDPGEVRRMSLRKEELYREVAREWVLEPLPGIREFLERLQRAEIPCALASSTQRLNITTSLGILGLGHFFRVLVTAEDVSHGKPDPEVFVKAAAGIARPNNRCVVFEDAPVGIEAALAAGMKAVGVTTTHAPAVLSRAHLAVRRLDELDVARLEALFG
jgi:HAD superfamily hydrolase (TIGR01509 family)